MNDKLIAEARELCHRYERQNYIPPSMLKKARELANALEKAEKQIPRWIPCEEMMPDFNDHSYHPVAHDCICRDIHNQYAVAMYYSPVTDKCNPWITSDEDLDTDLITHWMPLPKGAEEEK